MKTLFKVSAAATVRAMFAATLFMFCAQSALAQDEIVLTVTGTAEPAEFTMAELQAMPATSFETTTIWTEGAQSFTGVSLHSFLAELGVEGGTLNAAAINDYVVEIPVADAVEGGPIIAYARNGEVMSVRNNGPLWIVYPYDSNADYQSEVIYARSIWQLVRIDVVQ